MGQWVELELRKEQFDLIVECLEAQCCESKDFYDIERYVFLIDDLHNQKDEYFRKLYEESDIKVQG